MPNIQPQPGPYQGLFSSAAAFIDLRMWKYQSCAQAPLHVNLPSFFTHKVGCEVPIPSWLKSHLPPPRILL